MIIRSAIKSSARINVVVLYLTQIVEKLKGFLTWLTIWQYMSTVVCMNYNLEYATYIMSSYIERSIKSELFGLVDSDQFTDMLIVWDIFYFSGGSHIV